MKKLCFCAVIFPENLKYFGAFLESLNQQTDKDFKLMLFNDSVSDLQLYLKNIKFDIVVVDVDGSPSDIRKQMLLYVKRSGFESVVFGDTDDFFPNNRVEICRLLLKKYSVIVNDLCLVNSEGGIIAPNYWKNRTELTENITLESILHYNFLGLGNTAMRTNSLPSFIEFAKNLIAVDWYLFTKIFIGSDINVSFTTETFTYYRQHNSNSIGIKPLTLQAFKKGFEVKLQHYTSLSKESLTFRNLENQFSKHRHKVESMTESDLKRYVSKVRHPFWWEEITI